MRHLRSILLALLFPIVCCANNPNKVSVDFLGVDFSSVDIVGADEAPYKFSTAFEGINGLLLTEPAKFNAAKFFNLNVNSIDIDHAVERIPLHLSDNYLTKNKEQVSTSKIINAYPKSAGNKLLIIAVELNKTMALGRYQAVIFDGESKEIITEQSIYGQAGGFGLRNYWAGSLYSAMKRAKAVVK